MLRASILCFLSCAALTAAERINHEGRILGVQPVVTTPLLFNTAAADAVTSAMQIMPRDSAWNEDIRLRPVAANSAAIIGNIRSDVFTGLAGHAFANRQRLVVFKEMNYVLVPDGQALTDIDFTGYPDESDDLKPVGPGNNPQHIGAWPIPVSMPVESWPAEQPGLTNLQWQQDVNSDGGDRHSIIVMPGTGTLWETWQAVLTTASPAWQASNGAKFPLTTNVPRTAGFTSGDAAGLPMFPALVRFDEAQRGMVEHAMRIVVKRSRTSFIYPASHQAGSTADANMPAMGQRLRLKSSFVIPASWSVPERAIALGLKKYGALVADNGGFFSISICPDDRWAANAFDHLATGAGSDFCDITNFEVVDATAENGGPRSAGAPTSAAGADQAVTLAAGAALTGSATGSGLTSTWSLYTTPTPPGTVAFGDAHVLATTATFSAVGTYTLLLTVSDGVHTPAYDAVVVTVAAGSNPAPVLNLIAPTTAVQNSGAFTMTLTGSNFVPSATVTWSGHAALPVVTASTTQLTVAVPAAYLSAAGTPSITVINPGPGGGTSAAQTFTITADTTAPIISGITAGSLTVSSATIGWTTNEPSDSQIEFGLTAAYGSTTTLDTALVTSHGQLVGGLTPVTVYHYRIRTRDDAGNLTLSGDQTFTTTASSGGSGGGSSGGSFPNPGASGDDGGGGGCGLGATAALLFISVGLACRSRS